MKKIVDKRNLSESGEYAISFSSREKGELYDHAFIVWYYSNAEGKRTDMRAAGFYAVGADSMYDLIIGGVPGKVLDDSNEKINKQIIVLINKSIFETALQVEKKYQDSTYRLGTNDCVTFVSKVAEVIPGLEIPSRVLNIYPSSFIAALYNDN